MIGTICLEFRSILFGVRGLANKHGLVLKTPSQKKTNNGKVANFQADSADFLSNSNFGAKKTLGSHHYVLIRDFASLCCT